LGRKDVAEALRAAGCRVELHDDYFTPTTKDTEWLRAIGERRWILLSKDFSIARNELERITLFESGVRAFLLTEQDLPGSAMATAFVRAVRRMRHIARDERPPFIARVSASGKVKVLTELRRAWKRSRKTRSHKSAGPRRP
jgi:hypothetical protein